MIERRDVMPINFLKKERFTGSYKGMWPEPYAFLATPDEQKTWKEFPFTEDGIVSGVEWLNEQYDA